MFKTIILALLVGLLVSPKQAAASNWDHEFPLDVAVKIVDAIRSEEVPERAGELGMVEIDGKWADYRVMDNQINKSSKFGRNIFSIGSHELCGEKICPAALFYITEDKAKFLAEADYVIGVSLIADRFLNELNIEHFDDIATPGVPESDDRSCGEIKDDATRLQCFDGKVEGGSGFTLEDRRALLGMITFESPTVNGGDLNGCTVYLWNRDGVEVIEGEIDLSNLDQMKSQPKIESVSGDSKYGFEFVAKIGRKYQRTRVLEGMGRHQYNDRSQFFVTASNSADVNDVGALLLKRAAECQP